jgi:N-terminal domain of toast_rack, DUF2154/LiaI-LiaF-like transmembrane region
MANEAPRRRGSFTGALLLIIVGLLFLYANLRPEWNPWPLISRYWPVLLIVLGLGKLWDALRAPSAPGAVQPVRRGGETVAIIILLLLLAFVLFRGHGYSRPLHETKSIDAQGAQSVRMDIEMPAGELNISGGAAKLLDADFNYTQVEGEPRISYDHSGTDGNLSITQTGNSHFGRTENDWTLRLNNDLARELRVQMGAGQGNLNLVGIHLTKLTVEIGAGEINADLTGDWKDNVDVRIEGGVGSATIRLPKSVGVHVHAEGGIGSIDVEGLRNDGGDYVNDAYGKSPVTMNVRAEGGIGQIRLTEE